MSPYNNIIVIIDPAEDNQTALLKAERVKLNREVEQARMALSKAEKILKSLKKEDRERLARLEAERENKILDESKKYAASYP